MYVLSSKLDCEFLKDKGSFIHLFTDVYSVSSILGALSLVLGLEAHYTWASSAQRTYSVSTDCMNGFGLNQVISGVFENF